MLMSVYAGAEVGVIYAAHGEEGGIGIARSDTSHTHTTGSIDRHGVAGSCWRDRVARVG